MSNYTKDDLDAIPFNIISRPCKIKIFHSPLEVYAELIVKAQHYILFQFLHLLHVVPETERQQQSGL